MHLCTGRCILPGGDSGMRTYTADLILRLCDNSPYTQHYTHMFLFCFFLLYKIFFLNAIGFMKKYKVF